MKSDRSKGLARSQQVRQRSSENAVRGIPAGAGPGPGSTARVYKLANMTYAELSALTQRHNKQFGLMDDVLAPVMRGVLDTATARPPAVHPFSIGGGGTRKDEYRAAWKSISKRHAVSTTAPTGVATAASGAAAVPANSNLVAGAAATQRASTVPSTRATPVPLPEPSRADMYGTVEQPAAQLHFMSSLTAWLGVGPIDMPLLAPDAPPLSLKHLLMEVLDAGGSTAIPSCSSESGGNRPVLTWSDLAGKLLWDEGLADVLEQVYDAYLLPLERRLPTGIRSRRVEAWIQEDSRRRASLSSDGVTATAEQVDAQLDAARTALQALERLHILQRKQQPESSSVVLETTHNEDGEPLEDLATSAAAAVALSIPGSPFSPAAEHLRAIRSAAVGAGSLLPPSPVSGGKRTRSTSRSRRRGRSSGRKSGPRDVSESRANCGPGGRLSVSVMDGGSPACAGNDGTSQAPDLADVKVAATLALVTSLRELRAGPPGYGTHKPDLQANFLSRWQTQQAAKLVEEEEEEAAMAEAVSIPAGADVFASATAAAAAPGAAPAASNAERPLAEADMDGNSGAGTHGDDRAATELYLGVAGDCDKRPRLSELCAGPTAATSQPPPVSDHPRRRSQEGSLSPRAAPHLQHPAQGHLTKHDEQIAHVLPQPMLAGQQDQNTTYQRMPQSENTYTIRMGRPPPGPTPHPPMQVPSKPNQAPYSIAKTAGLVLRPPSAGLRSEAALSFAGTQPEHNGFTSLPTLPPSQQHSSVVARQSLSQPHQRAWDAGGSSSLTQLNGGGSLTHSGSGSMSYQSSAGFVLDLNWTGDT